MNESTSSSPATQDNAISGDERNWGVFAHLSTFFGFLCPFGNILGPLVIWLVQKDEMPFVDDQAKEALNFQITMSIAFVVAAVLILVLIGFLLLAALVVADIILTVMAAMEASKGKAYRYPVNLRLIR